MNCCFVPHWIWKLSIACLCFTFGNGSAFGQMVFQPGDSLGEYLQEEIFTAMISPTFELNSTGARAYDLSKMPVISLGSEERVVLKFDILGSDQDILYYTLLHCDNSWRVSELEPDDYIGGVTEDIVHDFWFSNATIHSYVHYEVPIPNDFMQPVLSGNYMLVVYDEAQTLKVLKKFAVTESQSLVFDTQIVPSREATKARTHQDVYFKVDIERLPQYLGPENVSVTIQQNGRWDNAMFNAKPSFTTFQEWTYNTPGKTVFEGGNEFRRFEFSNLNAFGFGVDRIDKLDDETFVYVEDRPVKNNDYSFFQDQNGGMAIVHAFQANSHTEADYAEVTFRLETSTPLYGSRIFLMGACTQWSLDEGSELKYRPEESAYVLRKTMKQGYYNYAYVSSEDGKEASFLPFERSTSETENDYRIYVYYNWPFSAAQPYDRLMQVLDASTATR